MPPEDVREFSAFADLFAYGAVAAFGADAGGDQIAHTGQAAEGGFHGAHGDAQAGDFDEAARDEGGFGVVPRGQAIEDSGGDGDDIFGGAGQFGADHVSVGVDAEPLGGESRLDAFGQVGVLGGGDGGGGQIAGQFGGDVGAGQGGERQRRPTTSSG